MMYTLNASGQTGTGNQPVSLWAAASDGTRLRIQNQSYVPIFVIVTLPDASTLQFVLPTYGDYIDETWVDPTLAVAVRSAFEGAAFAAVRLT